jgi:hypothetical protein
MSLDLPHKDKHYSSRVFTVSIIIFVAASSLSYALLNFASINFPHYYPMLRVFTTDLIEGQVAMAHFGRLATAFLFGFIGLIIYWTIQPLIRRFDLLHTSHAMVMMSTTLWLSVAIIIIEEWLNWGIAERNLDTPTLFNREFFLLFSGLLLFFFGLLFNSGFEHRVARSVRKSRQAKKSVYTAR